VLVKGNKITPQVLKCILKEEKNCIQTPEELFITRMAEAPASSAIFALVVKLHCPRCTKMISPVS